MRTSSRFFLPFLALCSLVLGAAACGSGESSSAGSDPATLAPARASVYVEATLKPSGDQADAVKSLSSKLAGISDPGAEIRKAIEKSAREDDPSFSFADDVEPWLGDKVGVFVTNLRQGTGGDDVQADAAAIVSTTDAGKAQAFIDEQVKNDKKAKYEARTYRDVKYKFDASDDTALAIVDGRLVAGTEPALKAAIETSDGGERLSDADGYKKARGAVSSGGLGFAYIGVQSLFSGLGPQGAAASSVLGGLGDQVAMALEAADDAITLDAASLGVSSDAAGAAGPGSVFETLPGDAWAALGAADLGGSFSRALEQVKSLASLGGTDLDKSLQQLKQQTGIDVRADLIDWMGDAGLFVRGDSLASIGGALVVQSKDPAATRRAIPKLARFLRTQDPSLRATPLSKPGVDAGVTLKSDQLPVPISIALAGDRFIVAATDAGLQAAVSSSSKLGDAQAYRKASGRLGDGIKPSLFIDAAGIARLVDALGVANQDGVAEFRRALDKLTSVVAGSKRDGDTSRFKLVVGVK